MNTFANSSSIGHIRPLRGGFAHVNQPVAVGVYETTAGVQEKFSPKSSSLDEVFGQMSSSMDEVFGQITDTQGLFQDFIQDIMLMIEEEVEDPPTVSSIRTAVSFAKTLANHLRLNSLSIRPDICMSAIGGISFNWLISEHFISVQIYPNPESGPRFYSVLDNTVDEHELNSQTISILVGILARVQSLGL